MRKIRGRLVSLALVSVLALSGIPCAMTARAEEADAGITAEQTETKKESLEEISEETLAVNEANFPDAVFRSYLSDTFDPDGDGMIDPERVVQILIPSFLDGSGNIIHQKYDHISSFQGIEYFTNLGEFGCEGFNLSDLDLSRNTNLTLLYCSGNQLTELDLSHNPKLLRLYCDSNKLTTLDLSNNPDLEEINCYDNNLNSLDLSHNPKLTNLYCGENNLSSLDLSHNPELKNINCEKNNLSVLDLSNNPKVTSLGCGFNNLTTLDISKLTELNGLGYDYEKVGAMDLSIYPSLNFVSLYFEKLPETGTLDLSDLKFKMEGLDMENVNYTLKKVASEYYWSYYNNETRLFDFYVKTVEEKTPKPDVPITPDEPDGSVTPDVTGIFYLSQDRNGIMAGLCTEGLDKSKYEFSWYVCRDGKNWIMVQDWTPGNEWLFYRPKKNGDYVLVGKARPIGGSDADILFASSYFSYHHEICGRCQMPYDGEGGGYLIGFESYENPNQSYQYEMLVLDCTKLANGEDAWIYTTGKCGAGDGKALWTVWQPQYGYYWTLFRVYDADGNIIDEACYGFANI